MATSRRISRVELAPELKAAIRRLQKRQRQQIGEVITAVRDGFGTPHLHSGLGIRRLRGSLFECRIGLKLRLIFDVEPGVLALADISKTLSRRIRRVPILPLSINGRQGRNSSIITPRPLSKPLRASLK